MRALKGNATRLLGGLDAVFIIFAERAPEGLIFISSGVKFVVLGHAGPPIASRFRLEISLTFLISEGVV